MAYYYTPIKTASGGLIEVAKDEGGEVVSAMEDLIGGIHTLKLDRELNRYVLDCPEDQPTLSGWDVKTAEEVNTDYPGLIEGV